MVPCAPSGNRENCAMLYFVKEALERLMRKMSSFSETGRSTKALNYFGTVEYFSENFDGEISLYANESYDERAV